MKVSVIIPTYNTGRYLAEAIDSVLNQTLKAHEIIVVDDGSTDNTKEIIKSYGNKIIGLGHQRNAGIAATVNTGLTDFTGDVFCWLSADDTWEPDKLEVQNSIAIGYPDSIIYSAYKCFSKTKVYPTLQGRDVNETGTRKHCFMNFSTAWIPKTAIEKVGLFNEEFRFYEDYEWCLRAALEHKLDFKFIPTSLANRRIHYNQVTVTHDKLLAAKYNAKIAKLIFHYTKE